MHDPAIGQWQTPNGRSVTFEYRQDTNDWNTIQSCTAADEYQLRGQRVDGWALDIGAHIGGVTLAILADNPTAHVVAIEPVPDNLRLLRRNLDLNGFTDRAIVVDGAAGPPDVAETVIRYNFRGDANLLHHAHIGNTALVYERAGIEEHDERTAPVYSYSALWRLVEEPPSFVKIDCEGAEYGFLADPAVGGCPLIIGEWHPVPWQGVGRTRLDILELLGESHWITFTGPEAGPGGFRAVRR